MDFYKKISKSKDVSNILSEKEYKCVSLQAIIGEAVRQNNKERIKDLVEEINGHLTDLRHIKDDKELKNKEKCDKLIKQYEDCLMKIASKKPADGSLLRILNQKLNELQQQSNFAVKENRAEELKKLIEKIKMDLEVIKEMPEVKNAKSVGKGEEYLKIVSTYEELLKVISDQLCKSRRIVSGPISTEDYQKMIQGSQQEPNNPPQKPSKVGLNEVEEKLKLMRQKRLNRLSTFVDQQTKLSEQRSRENSPKNSNKSLENLNQITESEDIETAIKSIQQPKMANLTSFKIENIGVTQEQKTSTKNVERILEGTDKKLQMASPQEKSTRNMAPLKQVYENVKISATASGKQVDINASLRETIHIKEESIIQTRKEIYREDKNKDPVTEQSPSAIRSIGKGNMTRNFTGRTVEIGRVQDAIPKREDLTQRTRENINNKTNMEENMQSLTEQSPSSVRKSFGKGTITRSFAERAIENAKKQAASDKPPTQLKPSNSLKTTPPRTPTQIRKIFNKFNSCVLGSTNNKSIEDLPSEYNSVFEKELKTMQLKSMNFERRLENFKDNPKESSRIPDPPRIPVDRPSDVPPAVPKRTKLPQDKTESEKSRVFGLKGFEKYNEDVRSSNEDIERGQTEATSTSTQRLSADYETISVREHPPMNTLATDVIITIKRDSNTKTDEAERHSFSTFRSSTDSLKNPDTYLVENPIYGINNNLQTISKQSLNDKNDDDSKSTDSFEDTCSVENSLYGTFNKDSWSENNLNKGKKISSLNSEKLFKELIINSNSVGELLKIMSSKDLQNHDINTELKVANDILTDIKRYLENSLKINKDKRDFSLFRRFFEEINAIENAISSFKGLKKDVEYFMLDKQLAKYYVEIDEIRPQTQNERNEKSILTERLRMANKNLIEKVKRNEEMLRMVLQEQVTLLAEKYGIA